MFIGLVFAGGGSRRMGCDKATMALAGMTLLERAILTVRAAGGTPLVLTPPRPKAMLFGARAIDETDGGAPGGPLPALARGLREILAGAAAPPRPAATSRPAGTPRPVPTPVVVALACDLPLVPPSLLRALADHPGDWDALVPRAGGVLQVLAAAYRPACLPAIEAALAAGDRSIHRWLGGVRLEVIEEDALRSHGGASIFVNVNTPEDRAAAEAALDAALDAAPRVARDRVRS